jgi:uncharacterized protein YkwD
MNYVDLLLLAILLLSIWISIKRGFIISMLELLAWVGSLVISFILYPYLGWFFERFIPSLGVWSIPLAFLLIVFISRIALDSLSSRLIDATPGRAHDHAVNKVFGIVPGLINGFIWSVLLVAFLLMLPLANGISDKARDSKLADKLVVNVGWLQNKLIPIFSEALNAAPKKESKVSDEELVELPYKVKSPKERPDLEAEMLVLVNKERTSRGLKALKADPEIAVVALKHSADMFARGYFSHISPEGVDPFERMKKENVRFYTAGENLALAQTLNMAHTGLMNSPGHRANILNPTFGRLGIGILDGGIYGLMITQNFRN